MALQRRFDGQEENPGPSARSSRPPHRLSPSAPPTIRIAPMLHGFAIDWTTPDSPIPIAGYRVYRRDGEGDPRPLGYAAANACSFFDLDVEVGQSYSYFVAAINFLGEGPPSEDVVGKVAEHGLTGSSG